MEWQFKSVAKQCRASGEEFVLGESVICYIFKQPNGHIERIDIKKAALEGFKMEGEIIGKWERTIHENQIAEERQLKKRGLEAAEELFHSLFIEENPFVEEERLTLKLLLALLLERKRILKRMPQSTASTDLDYIHSKSGDRFVIPQITMRAEMVEKLKPVLDRII